MRLVRPLASVAIAGLLGSVLTTSFTPVPAQAVSVPGNVADHTLQPVPSMVIRPGSWRETNDTLVRQDADAAASKGLLGKGWNIIAVDDDWMVRKDCTDWDTARTPVPDCSGGRDTDGHPIASPSKYPQGIKATLDYVHGKGFKFGIYTDGGTATCDGGSSMWDHFQADANYFASIGVDYIKSDYCYNYDNTSNGWPLTTDHDADIAIDSYRQAAEAIKAANTTYGTKMVLNASPPAYFNWHNDATGTAVYQKVVAGLGKYAQQWRIGGDNGGSTWSAMLTTLAQGVGSAQFARAGHFNDLDQLAFGKGSLTRSQAQSEFSLWAQMAAPLNIKVNGTAGFTADLVSDAGNSDVIAVSQDRLGVQGKRTFDDANTSVYTKPLSNGDFSVVLLNKSTSARTISTTTTAVGTSATAFTLKDLWTKTVTNSTGAISATVPATSAVHYRLHPTSNNYTTWRRALNATVISDDDASTAGCFDNACDSFSADALADAGAVAGGVVTVSSKSFDWPGAGSGQLDSITARGQRINYSTAKPTLAFLGASSGGDVSGTITLNYTDGTTSTATLGFPNWVTSNPAAFGCTTAVTAKHRNTPTGPDNFGTNYRVSYLGVPVTAGKTLQSFTLPNNPALHIFSITT